jgi:hypothetical protein
MLLEGCRLELGSAGGRRAKEKASGRNAVRNTVRNDDEATKFASPITQPSSFGPASGAIIPKLRLGNRRMIGRERWHSCKLLPGAVSALCLLSDGVQ